MNKKLVILIALFVFLFIQNIKAQPPCPPFSPCWCNERPTHPKCQPTGVPIDDHLWLLVAAGGLLAFYYRKKLTTNQLR